MQKRSSNLQRKRLLKRSALLSLLTAISLGLPLFATQPEPQTNQQLGRGAGTFRRGGTLLPGPRPAQPTPPTQTPPTQNPTPPTPANQRTAARPGSNSAPNAPGTPIPTNKIDRINAAPNSKEFAPPPVNVATEEERHQVIAPDWKDPWIVFYITGRQYGYIEPCGCTGLENQKGGLMRRDSLLESVRKRGWEVLPIDAGNQVRRVGKQDEIKFDWSTKAFQTMGYAAVGFGEDDLTLSHDFLVYQLVNTGADSSSDQTPLFVSANVSVFDGLDTPFRVIQVGKRKIGITSVLGDENATKLANKAESISVKPALDGLKEVKGLLDKEKCDFKVLIAHASLEESRSLAQKIPGFDLVVTAGGYGEPTYRPEEIPGTKSLMVQVGTKGMYAGLVGLFDNPREPLRYQRIALSSQFEDSSRMTELFAKYQDQLKAEGMERLGKRPQTHPTQREFVGAEKCGECHTTAFDIWKNTPHAHATDSIVNPPQRSIARDFDPECIACHTTGWNPADFLPYKTGFVSVEATPHMNGNGCENCHGPGKDHVDAESGDVQATKEMLIKLRQEMQLPLQKAHDKCLECHDIDNSPDFHKNDAFEQYWEKVKHYGKD